MDVKMEAFKLVRDLDELFSEVIDGKKIDLGKLDELIKVALGYERALEQEIDKEIISYVIKAFSMKVDLINKILELNEDNGKSMEMIRKKFQHLEMKRFEIVNNYVVGIIKKSDLDSFKDMLFSFRKELYAIPISDSNLMEIAKMKSKIQHFETEVLEDEDVLQVAYANEL